MSTDLTAAHEALREILAGLDASVAHLREIADGLRDTPESELPPEPAIGSVVLVVGVDPQPLEGYVVRRYRHGWCPPGGDGGLTWPEVCSLGTPVPLVRADQTVVLPTEFSNVPVIAWNRYADRRITAWPSVSTSPEPSTTMVLTVADRPGGGGELLSITLPNADAERWALEVLALVRSKGGAR